MTALHHDVVLQTGSQTSVNEMPCHSQEHSFTYTPTLRSQASYCFVRYTQNLERQHVSRPQSLQGRSTLRHCDCCYVCNWWSATARHLLHSAAVVDRLYWPATMFQLCLVLHNEHLLCDGAPTQLNWHRRRCCYFSSCSTYTVHHLRYCCRPS
jgi:hypothetical protein